MIDNITVNIYGFNGTVVSKFEESKQKFIYSLRMEYAPVLLTQDQVNKYIMFLEYVSTILETLNA